MAGNSRRHRPPTEGVAGLSATSADLDNPIDVRDVVKHFRRTVAVDGVTFTVPAGQLCALLGPNGAGKTTMIHILLGLTLPTSGTVRVLGHDVVKDRTAAIKRTNFSASYVKFPWRMTVGEVLRVYCELYEVDDPSRAVDEVTQLFDIGHLTGQLAQTLSSGQETLVGLAKALLNNPKLLFLDEPTASLDPEHAFEIRTILRRVVTERGITVLITSHNMPEIERMADRILFLSKGRLIADATAAELREQFKAADLEEVFLTVARESRTQ
jgi:ABC-2 type transport system ATP-binding protein